MVVSLVQVSVVSVVQFSVVVSVVQVSVVVSVVQVFVVVSVVQVSVVVSVCHVWASLMGAAEMKHCGVSHVTARITSSPVRRYILCCESSS